MAKSSFASVDQYLVAQPKVAERVLRRVRATIRRALPGAHEVISYGMPAYKLNGRVVLYFAGWKEHYSLYPATDRLVQAFKDELEPYEASGKGTIRFPLAEPIPVKLIAGIAKFLAAEVGRGARARATAAKKR